VPEYSYQGIDKAGKKVAGKMDSPNEGEVRIALRGMGVRPTRINKEGAKRNLFGAQIRSVPTEALVTFTRQLQVLISSGIPIVQGLDILYDQSGNASLKVIIGAVKEKVSAGSYFWESLSAYPLVFPKLYISLIRAGEASGSLDQMLKRLTRYVEDSERTRKMVRGAMMYPAIVVCIGAGVVSLMMVFVIPKFEDMLKGNGQELPLITQMVIHASHFMIANILYLVSGVGFAIYIFLKYIKTPEGRALIDRMFFHFPLFGGMMQKSGIARFSRTMQTLLASGVNLIDAIDICKATIDNAVLEDAVSKIRSEVEAGKTLGMVISKIALFPRMAVQMISVGESTGNMDKMLEKVADFYESEVEILVGGMTKLIEPLVLVVLGGDGWWYYDCDVFAYLQNGRRRSIVCRKFSRVKQSLGNRLQFRN